jgi:hypothetical protein
VTAGVNPSREGFYPKVVDMNCLRIFAVAEPFPVGMLLKKVADLP